MSSASKRTSIPPARSTGIPTAAESASAAADTAKAESSSTSALLATTRRRRGSAASVERNEPVAYSPVITSTPSTEIASCAMG